MNGEESSGDDADDGDDGDDKKVFLNKLEYLRNRRRHTKNIAFQLMSGRLGRAVDRKRRTLADIFLKRNFANILERNPLLLGIGYTMEYSKLSVVVFYLKTKLVFL